MAMQPFTRKLRRRLQMRFITDVHAPGQALPKTYGMKPSFSALCRSSLEVQRCLRVASQEKQSRMYAQKDACMITNLAPLVNH